LRRDRRGLDFGVTSLGTVDDYHLLRNLLAAPPHALELAGGLRLWLGVKRQTAPNTFELLGADGIDLAAEPLDSIFVGVDSNGLVYHLYAEGDRCRIAPMIHIMLWDDETQQRFDKNLRAVIAAVRSIRPRF
jgi:hypothetical protein